MPFPSSPSSPFLPTLTLYFSVFTMDGTTHALKSQLRELLLKNSVFEGTFTLASGRTSNFYVDSKRTTFHPLGLTLIGEIGWRIVSEKMNSCPQRPGFVGGLTMGADAIASSIILESYRKDPAHALQSLAVRKEAKSHGRHKLIEGCFEAGDTVMVLDDVITTGKSTLQAIDAIEEAGGHIAFVFVLVDREEGGREEIQKRGHEVISLFTKSELVGSQKDERSRELSAVVG